MHADIRLYVPKALWKQATKSLKGCFVWIIRLKDKGTSYMTDRSPGHCSDDGMNFYQADQPRGGV